MSVGVTEAYEPSLTFGWVNSQCDMNVIITKNLTKVMFLPLLEMKRNTILHATCTGLGKTFEPGAPSVGETIHATSELIKAGFPPEQIVFRIDPIIPVPQGINLVKQIVEKFKSDQYTQAVKRVRYSFMDNYKHLALRFFRRSLEIPKAYNGSFNATEQYVMNTVKALLEIESAYDIELETCGEGFYHIIPEHHRIGCISKKDCRNLGLDECLVLEGANTQGRPHCQCEAKKTELIPVHKPCSIDCVYCYMKNPLERI